MKRAIVALLGLLTFFWIVKKAGASQVDSGGADSGGLFYVSLGKIVDRQKLSNTGLQRLKNREGFSAMRYPDPPNSGKFSIGYGHQLQAGENYTTIDESTAALLLLQDVSTAESAVNNNVSVSLTQYQFDALVSFVYNIGSGAFVAGTVPEKLNNGDFSSATATMKLYTNSGGVRSSVLVARRNEEVAQFYG
jgi:lysozyme